MPIYEYRCEDCDRVTSVFVRSARSQATSSCEHCGSERLQRLISRTARVKSASDVIEERGIPGAGGSYEDPRQIGAWVEKRFEEYGVDIPEETREMIDAARDGELPDSVSDL
jgi:putative FmdB family regulatory protein